MGSNKEKDEAAVKEWVEMYFTFLHNGEVDKWYELWDDNVTVLPPNRPPFYGIEALKEITKPGFEKYDYTQTLRSLEIQTDINIAFDLYNGVEYRTPKEGGNAIGNDSKCLWILKRQPDDSW
jgi:ketosteroid isomerase-like protein